MNNRRVLAGFLALAVTIALAPLVHAEPAAPAAQEGTALEFTFAPYFLLPNMSGDVALNGIDMEVNVGPSDIFDNLEFGLMGYLEVRKGSWGGRVRFSLHGSREGR